MTPGLEQGDDPVAGAVEENADGVAVRARVRRLRRCPQRRSRPRIYTSVYIPRSLVGSPAEP